MIFTESRGVWKWPLRKENLRSRVNFDFTEKVSSPLKKGNAENCGARYRFVLLLRDRNGREGGSSGETSRDFDRPSRLRVFSRGRGFTFGQFNLHNSSVLFGRSIDRGRLKHRLGITLLAFRVTIGDPCNRG